MVISFWVCFQVRTVNMFDYLSGLDSNHSGRWLEKNNWDPTVDGRTPAPPDMHETLQTIGHLPYQVVSSPSTVPVVSGITENAIFSRFKVTSSTSKEWTSKFHTLYPGSPNGHHILIRLVYKFHQMLGRWLTNAGGYKSHALLKRMVYAFIFQVSLGTLGSHDFHEKNHGNHYWSYWILTVTQAKTLVIEAVSRGEKKYYPEPTQYFMVHVTISGLVSRRKNASRWWVSNHFLFHPEIGEDEPMLTNMIWFK